MKKAARREQEGLVISGRPKLVLANQRTIRRNRRGTAGSQRGS